MIKEKIITISISYRNISHYLKLGYDAFLNKNLDIKPEHLPSGSHVRITAICDICHAETSIQYYKYLENMKRCNFYGCRKCSRQKASLTSIERYGVDNYSKTSECKEKVEKTNIEKFGYKTNLISPEYQEKIKEILKDKYGTENFYEITERKNRIPFKLNDIIFNLSHDIIYSEDSYDNSITNNNYSLYKNECTRLTDKNIKKLYKEWNGLDYYTNIDISENFKLDPNDPLYPTIDHKNATYYGFTHNIPVEEISDISNLCITTRHNNSKKRDLTENDFKLNKLNLKN